MTSATKKPFDVQYWTSELYDPSKNEVGPLWALTKSGGFLNFSTSGLYRKEWVDLSSKPLNQKDSGFEQSFIYSAFISSKTFDKTSLLKSISIKFPRKSDPQPFKTTFLSKTLVFLIRKLF